MTGRTAERIRLAIAVLGWATLALQLYLIVGVNVANGTGWLTGVVRFFSFFTILTNILVATVLSAPWLPSSAREWLSRATVHGAAAAYIAMVGIIYSLVLRALWDPQGLQKVADMTLHDVMPVLYIGFWIVFLRTGTLRWPNVWSWLVYPIAYLGYSLARGAFARWYPYPFLDAGAHGYLQVLINALGITIAFAILSLVIVAIDRLPYRLTARIPASG